MEPQSNQDQALLSIAQKLGLSTEESTRTVQELGAITDRLSSATKQQSESVTKIYSDAAEIQNIFDASNSNAQKSINKLNQSNNAIESAFSRIEASLQEFENIKKSTKSIYQIVKQTRILSVNAAVEAARAGDSGKGFSIVANEMRELAKACEEATKHIEGVIDNTWRQLNEVVTDSQVQVQSGIDSTLDVDDALDNLVGVFNGGTGNERPSVNAIINSINDIESFANETSGIASDSQKATETLNHEVEVSNQILSDFMGQITGTPIINIEPLDAVTQLGNFRIIDVRRPDEFSADLGHISRSKLIPIHERGFKKQIAKMDRERVYLFVCRSGGRSARAAQIAQVLGYKHVFNLKGGMLAWNMCQLPIHH